MATTSGTVNFYDSWAEYAFEDADLNADTFKMGLETSSYTPSVSTEDEYSDITTNEVSQANGYTTGGETITNNSQTQTGGAGKFDFDNVVWTASGGSIVARYYFVYDNSTTTKYLICYGNLDDTPLDVTTTDTNTLTVQINANGLFTVTLTDSA